MVSVRFNDYSEPRLCLTSDFNVTSDVIYVLTTFHLLLKLFFKKHTRILQLLVKSVQSETSPQVYL